MESIDLPCYTLISNPSDVEPPNETQLKLDLEKGERSDKIEAMKKIIRYISNGDRLPGLLVPIIRFVLPSQDHAIKKLLLIFWEIVPKTTADGKLLQEIILVCDAYRKDLEHSNEYVRGSTLRFLCKLKEPELLEPLMSAIRSCLKHKSSYVRRNAILAIFTIYKNFPFLIPDGTELIASFLEDERDMSCKRNAFLMLLHSDLERALSYLVSCLDEVSSFGDILQLMVVQLMQKVCFENPSERSRFIRCIYGLLNSNSAAVKYEAAGTLLTLSNAPTAIKAAASCYIDLIVRESDNNVKLIVLDQLISLRESPIHEKVLQSLAMDILRVLSSHDLEVRKNALNLVLDLTTAQTVREVTAVLQKEVHRTRNGTDHDDRDKYLQLLVSVLHALSLKFADVASDVILCLLSCLSDSTESVACDIISFFRVAAHKFEQLRPIILQSLTNIFPSIKSLQVQQAALWILGEYTLSPNLIHAILENIKSSLGDIHSNRRDLKEPSRGKLEDTNKMITLDGAYATQVYATAALSKVSEHFPLLKQFLVEGNVIVGIAVARVLVKLAFHFIMADQIKSHYNKFISECMLVISSILNFCKTVSRVTPLEQDDLQQMLLCLKVLSQPNKAIFKIYTNECRKSIANMISVAEREKLFSDHERRQNSQLVEVDETVKFSQLSSLTKLDIDPENNPEISLHHAIQGKLFSTRNERSLMLSRLNNITQLTGISDPVYAEAYVRSNQYDIVLEVFMVNQTDDLLQNCTLELATLGDIKLVEKPQPCVLAPHDFCYTKAVVKITSTENGLIFGNITYDISGATSDKNIVFLNDIKIDIMDYIVPMTCSEMEFRKMWAVFEWENKISVNTKINNLNQYLDSMLKCTHMKCLNPEKVLYGQCEFLSANLYGKSIFGEDALVNLSLEKPLNEPISGHIRVRAKSQGMALYLGEMFNKAQNESSA